MNTSSSRRYATLEESEAVLPVFNTPTNMYLRQEFNPQPRFTNSNTSSPNPQSRYTPQQTSSQAKSKAFDPLYNTTSSSRYGSSSPQYNKPKEEPTQRTSPPPSTKAKDEIVAQLVDMGFSEWQARVAVDASENKNLQEALDLLVQNQKDNSSDEDEEQWKKQQEERKKDYLNELRSSPQPSFTTPLKPTPYTPPQPDSAVVYADNQRKQGNFSFNKGQFIEAEKLYTLAINALPKGHSDLALLLNNRAAAYIKQGKFKDCIKDCNVAIDLCKGDAMKPQLLKALHRKACALEGLQMYTEAIQVYEEYIRIDGRGNTQITQGIQRCQQGGAWKPAQDGESAFPNIDISIFMSSKLSQAELDEINNSKAVKEMRDREKQKEAEEAEKLKCEDQVNARISAWKAGKERNLRSLLSSLELILWQGVQWKPVLASDLFDVKKCKITYMKAIAKVHPDKLPANATVEQRMLASGVFTILNQAWDIFRTENNL